MPRRWMTTSQAAEFLGVHPNTIRNWADAGELPVLRTSGNQRRFDRSVLAQHALARGLGGRVGEPRLADPPAEAVTQRERYLSALAESASVSSSRGEFTDACATLARSTGEALGGATVDILLIHRDSDEVEFMGGWQREALHPDEWVVGDRIPVGSYPDWRAVADGSDGMIILCAGPELSPDERAEYAYWDETATMCVPLRYQGQLIGLLDITTRDKEQGFSDEDLAFAKVVAVHVATALTNARLIEGERARAAQMEALLTIAAAVNSSVGLPRSLAAICREMGVALAADVANLYTYDERQDQMVRAARWDRDQPRAARGKVGRRFSRDAFHASWTDAVAAGNPVVSDPSSTSGPGLDSPGGTVSRERPVVSWITAPLYQDGALRGLVDVYSRDPDHVFSDEDVLFAGAVARQVEIALRGSEMVENSRQRSERLEEVLAATQAMNASLDPAEVLAEVVLGFGRSLDVPEATIFEVSPGGRELVVSLSYFVKERRVDQEFIGERVRLSTYPTLARVVTDAKPLVLNRMMADQLEAAEVEIMERFGTRAWLAVPMIEDGRVVGVLDGSETRGERWFTQDDLRTAEIFAAQAVTGLARVRAYREEQQRARDLELLLSAAGTMAGSLELEAAMRRVCRAVGEALDFMYVTVYDWKEEEQTFEALLFYWGEDAAAADEGFVGSVFRAADEPVMHAVVRDRIPFWTSSRADPRLTPGERAEMNGYGAGSWLYVPMVFQDRAVGLLEVDFAEEGHRFSDHEVMLTQAIANQAAVIMVNAQLYERQRRQTQDLARTAAVRETLVRFGAGLRLRDTVPGVAQELAGALRELELFDAVAVLLHDPRANAYHVAQADGAASVSEGAVLPDHVVEAAAVAYALGGGPAARHEQKVAREALLEVMAERSGANVRLAGGLKRAIFAPIVDQQGESVGFVIARRSEAAGARDTSRAEAASLVRLLCDQAGIAIRAAHRLVDLQRNLEQAWTMNEVVTAVGSTLDVPEVLRQAVGGMRRVVDLERVSFWLLSPDEMQAEVTTLGGEGAGLSLTGGGTLEVSRDPADPVWQAIDAARVKRVTSAATAARVAGMQGTASLVILPLLAEGEAVGAVVVGSRQASHFDEGTTVFLEQFVAQIGAAVQNARLYERIRNLHLANLQALSTALNVKDVYMMTHAPRVAAYSALLCRKLGYDAARITNVEKAAFLHDIGRIGIPDQVLQKPDELSDHEWSLVRDHASVSADIIKPIFPEEVYLAVRHHHERWDGKGYPEGRKAAELPQLARVLTLVDAYDAMTTGSTHSRARTYEEAVAELWSCAGEQFDPGLVPPFVEVLGELEEARQTACAAAEAAAHAVDWTAHATLRSAGGAGREEYPAIEESLERVRESYPPVARLFTVVPDERGYVLAVGCADSSSLPHPGEEVHPPAELIETSGGVAPHANVLNIDAHGCWMSGFVPIIDAAGRLTAFVEADVAVETDVRGGAMPGADVGETLDSILRQAAARMTRIEMAANTDGLTGLYNHRYFQERLEQELARARTSDERLGLLFCDLDHFKLYNDTVGHQAGDEALRRLAAILHQELRRVDIAARYGGEEFAVILPDTGLQGAVEVAERVRAAVEKGHDEGLPLTVSIGVATFPDDAASAPELIDRADWAMYRAKRKGRNRVEVFGTDDEGGPTE